MCAPWAYEAFLKYKEVFPEIANILKSSGVKAKVKPTKDKTGFFVQVVQPDRIVVLDEEGEHGNWRIYLDGEVIELDIPVETRDAKALAAALLKAIGK